MIDYCFKRRSQAKAGYTQRNIAVSTSYFFLQKIEAKSSIHVI